MNAVVISLPLVMQSIVISVSVCMSLCLSACMSARIFQELHLQIVPHFLYTLHLAVGRSSCYGNTIRYVFPPVLCMTSCFHITATGQNQKRLVCFVEIVRGGTGDKVCRLQVHLVWFCNHFCLSYT